MTVRALSERCKVLLRRLVTKPLPTCRYEQPKDHEDTALSSNITFKKYVGSYLIINFFYEIKSGVFHSTLIKGKSMSANHKEQVNSISLLTTSII